MQNPVQTDVSCAMIFNNFDQPGRYIYIRDDRSSDFWSASWQPAGKDLAQYKSECRHGIGYTKISADYSDIHSEALYYVPLGKSYEVWALSVTNHSDHERNLTLSGYAEFTNHSNYEQDQVNLQYSLLFLVHCSKETELLSRFMEILMQFLKMRM